MPTLSSSNRSQLTYKLEGTYPTNFGTLMTAGSGTKLNMLSESLDFTVKTESSKAIRSDRQVSDIVQVGASAQGGFAFEHVYKEYDPFIQGVLQADYGTTAWVGGISAAITPTLTFTATTITASVATTGAFIFTILKKGQWFMLKPPAAASDAVKAWFASHPLRVSTTVVPSTTVITLDAATPINIAAEGSGGVGTTMATLAMMGSALASNGSVMKSYNMEVQHADIAQYRKYLGMIPSKMDLKLSVGSIVSGSFDFMGKSMTLAATTSMGTPAESQLFTPANATRGIFDIIEGGTSVTATTYIKSGDIMIDNSLRAQEAIGVFGNAGIAAGTMNVTGKLEVYFADAVMYSKLLNGAASSLAIPVVDVDGNGYVYYFPRIKYTAAKVNAGGLDQDNMLSMDWQALPDTTAGDTLGMTVVIYRVGF